MSESVVWLIIFLVVALAGLGGMFLYGWMRRKDEPPKVPPLPPDDDDWRR